MSQVSSIKVSHDLQLNWLKEFVLTELIPMEAKPSTAQQFELSIYRELHDKGFLQLITPKKYGGAEISATDLIWVFHEIGYGSASVAGSLLGNALGYTAVILFAKEKLRAAVCESYEKNFSLWSFAMSEAEVGSDLGKTQTVAREVDGGYKISGEKNFITNAGVAKQLVVFARLIDRSGVDQGVTCFYMTGDNPGLIRGEPLEKIVWSNSNTGTLYFKDAFVPNEHLLGEPGRGLKILGRCLNRSKGLMAAMAVGISHRALELAETRMSETERFDKKLIDQPAIRHLLAQLHTKVQAAWLLVLNAGAAWDAGLPTTKEASMAKLFAGKTASEVTNAVIELFATRGIYSSSEVARLWHEAKSCEIIEGPSFLQELLIAKEVLNVSRESKSQDKVVKFKTGQAA